MTEKKIPEKKKQIVAEVKKKLGEYKVIGILDMHKLPGKQLFEIRNKLKGEATITMTKKRLITLALKDAKLKGAEKLIEKIQGSPAILLSNTDPFKLARIINRSKSPAMAKPGDIAPINIVVKAGPTSLAAGPVIGELQRIKIPAAVEGEKISIRKDTTVAKAGDEISKDVADIIAKLGIEPMEIGLNLVAVWENGTIYDNEVLFIPQEKYEQDVLTAYGNALNLTLEIGYPTKYNLPMLITKAHGEAKALAMETGTVTKDTLGPLLAKGQAQKDELKKAAKADDLKPAAEEKKEEPKEEKPEEKKEEPKTEVKEEAKTDDNKEAKK